MIMSYNKKKFVKNPIESFMYFVPLIAPTLVDNISSVNNTQQVSIVSHKKKVTSKSFYAACDFEILGSGFHMNTFEPAGMIAARTDTLKKGETLTNMLDYIKFNGEGFGRIQVKGTMTGSTPTVTQVKLQFNRRGKSPVTIGLYDVKPKDGQYNYENRSNQIVARVNSLIFKKSSTAPHMGIEVGAITDKSESEGFLSGVKGAVANMFITPPKVTKLGNDTMLNFGFALLKQEPEFTFLKARNLRESKKAIDNKQN